MTEQQTPGTPHVRRFRSYWIFSAAITIVWVVVIILRTRMGGASTFRDMLLVFGGFAIGWVATTIARYVYPPARRWQKYYGGKP
jgi:hypothetical protein